MRHDKSTSILEQLLAAAANADWLHFDDVSSAGQVAGSYQLAVRIPRESVAGDAVELSMHVNGDTPQLSSNFDMLHMLSEQDIESGWVKLQLPDELPAFTGTVELSIKRDQRDDVELLSPKAYIGDTSAAVTSAAPVHKTGALSVTRDSKSDPSVIDQHALPVAKTAKASALQTAHFKLLDDDGLVNSEEVGAVSGEYSLLHLEVNVPAGTLLGELAVIIVEPPVGQTQIFMQPFSLEDLDTGKKTMRVPYNVLQDDASQAFVDGGYTLKLAIANGIGNTKFFDGSIDFTLDTTTSESLITISAISDDTGIDNDFITSDNRLTLFGVLDRALAIDERVEVSIDGGTSWVEAKVAGLSWQLKDSTDHRENFTYRVRVIDAAGNIASDDSREVVIDNQAPNSAGTEITLAADISDDDIIKAAEVGLDIPVRGIVTGEFTPGDTVTVRVNGKEFSGSVAADGRFAIDVPGGDLAADTDRVVEATVGASDVAGNVAEKWVIKDEEGYQVQLSPPVGDISDIDDLENLVALEGSDNAYVGLRALAVDPDDSVSYRLKDDANGAFKIDAITGEVRVADASKLSAGSLKVTVIAESDDESESEQDFEIQVLAGSRPEVSGISVANSGGNVEEGQILTFQVGLDKSFDIPTYFDFALTGQAVAGEDYSENYIFSNGVRLVNDGKFLLLPAGVSEFTLGVKTTADDIDEPNESVVVEIGGAQASGVIVDFSETGKPNVASITPNTEGDAKGDVVLEGQKMSYSIGMAAAADSAYTLSFTLAGTALLNKDYRVPTFSDGVTYNAKKQLITVPAGVQHFNVVIATKSDKANEVNESVELTIEKSSVTGSIVDKNNKGGKGVAVKSVSALAERVVEGDAIEFNVVLSAKTSKVTQVKMLMGGTASEGIDYAQALSFTGGVKYNPNTDTLSIPKNVTSFKVTVNTTDDVLDEQVETLSLALGASGISAHALILDNDEGVKTGTDVIAVAAERESVTEGDDIVVRVELFEASKAASLQPLTVSGSISSEDIGNPADFSFTRGVRYDADTGMLIIPKNVSDFEITIPTAEDGQVEPTEQVVINVGGVAENVALHSVNNNAPDAQDDNGYWVDASVGITGFSGASQTGIKHEDDLSTRKQGDLFDYASVGKEGASVLIYGGTETGVYYIQRVNADGTKEGSAVEYKGNQALSKMEFEPKITAIGDAGDYAVTFIGQAKNNATSVYVQKFDKDGDSVGSLQSIAIETAGVSQATSSNGSASATNQVTRVAHSGKFREMHDASVQEVVLDNGNTVRVWLGENAARAGDPNLYARVFDADGKALGKEFQVNQWQGTSDYKKNFGDITVAPSADGGFNVFWHTPYKSALESTDPNRTTSHHSTDLTVRSYDASGKALTDERILEDYQFYAGGANSESIGSGGNTNVVLMANGNSFVSWIEPNEITNQPEVKTMVLDQNLEVVHQEKGNLAVSTNYYKGYHNDYGNYEWSVESHSFDTAHWINVVETQQGLMLFTATGYKRYENNGDGEFSQYEAYSWVVDPTTNTRVGEAVQLTKVDKNASYLSVELVYDPTTQLFAAFHVKLSTNQLYRTDLDASGNIVNESSFVGSLNPKTARSLATLQWQSIAIEIDANGNTIAVYNYDVSSTVAGKSSSINATVFPSDGSSPTVSELNYAVGRGSTHDGELTHLADGTFNYTFSAGSNTVEQLSRWTGNFDIEGAGEPAPAPHQTSANEVYILEAGNSGAYATVFTSVNPETGTLNAYLQAFKSNGKKQGAIVNITPENLKDSAGVTDIQLQEVTDGFVLNFAVGEASYLQFLDNNFEVQGTEILLDAVSIDAQAITINHSEEVVVAYQSADAEGAQMLLKRFDLHGEQIGQTQRFDTKVGKQNVSDIQSALTALEDGGFVLVWSGAGAKDGSHDIYIRRFDSDANIVNSDRLDTPAGDDLNAHVVSVGDSGDYVVAWQSDAIYTQKYASDGTKIGGIVKTGPLDDLSAQATNVEVIALGENGQFATTFESAGSLYTQTYHADGSKAIIITNDNETGDFTLGALQGDDSTLYRVEYSKGTLLIDGVVLPSGSEIIASDWQNAIMQGVSREAFDLQLSVQQGYVTDESTPLTIDVLANDSDPDKDPISILTINGEDASKGQVVTIKENKTVLGTARVVAGEIEFTPGEALKNMDDGDRREISFDYTIQDSNGAQSDPATVRLTVEGLDDTNRTPVANDDEIAPDKEFQDVTGLVNLTNFTGGTSDVVDVTAHNGNGFVRTIEMTQLQNGNFVLLLETEEANSNLMESSYEYKYINQVFSSSGELLGSHDVSETTGFNQDDYKDVAGPDYYGYTTDITDIVVTALPDGSFVHTWGSPKDEVFMQKFDATGKKVGSKIQLQTPGTGDTLESNVDVLLNESTGELFVSYVSRSQAEETPGNQNVSNEVYVQRLSTDLTLAGDAVKVADMTGWVQDATNWQPRLVSSESNGDYYLAWTNDMGNTQASYTSYVNVRKFSEDGAPIGDAVTLTGMNRDKLTGFISTDDDGSYAVMMDSSSGGMGQTSLTVAIYDASTDTRREVKLDGEGHANNFSGNNGIDLSEQIHSVGQNGDFVVVWHGHSDLNEEKDLYVQHFNKSGEPKHTPPIKLESQIQDMIGVDYAATSGTFSDESRASVASLDAEGNYVVSWTGASDETSQTDTYYQRFDKDGNPDPQGPQTLYPADRATDTQSSFAHVGANGEDGSFTFVWNVEAEFSRYQTDTVKTQFAVIDANGNVVPTVDGNSTGNFDIDLSQLDSDINQIKIIFNKGTLTSGSKTYASGEVIPRADFDSLKFIGVKPKGFTFEVDALVDSYPTENDVLLIDVLDNDTDADSDELMIKTIEGQYVTAGQSIAIKAGNKTLGTAKVIGNEVEFTASSFLKKMDEGDTREISFTYTAEDRSGATSEPATVSFTIAGVDGVSQLSNGDVLRVNADFSVQSSEALNSQTAQDTFDSASERFNILDEGDRDIFVFHEDAISDAGQPHFEVIASFDQAKGDTLDLSEILQLDSTDEQQSLDQYIHFEQDGDATKVMINSQGLFTDGEVAGKAEQVITLENTDLVGGFSNDQEIIDHLIDNKMLIINDN
ncbi:MAG: Ig-like domain-containing protein [Pseudomonadales bacterium]